MKITIFAATGGVGRQALEQAMGAGHDVTVVVRDPKKLSEVRGAEQVRIVTVDLAASSSTVLESALQGTDAVLSCLGPRSTSDAGIAAQGTRSIVDAMQATGVRRIVVISAAPVGTTASPNRPKPPKYDPGDGFFMRHVFSRVAKTVFGKTYADLALMEDILRTSDLNWTVVRPPRLTDKPATGRYRTALAKNVMGGWSVPRADVAQLMLGVLHQPETIKQTIGIAS